MPEFLELVPPPQALARLMDHLPASPCAGNCRDRSSPGQGYGCPCAGAAPFAGFPSLPLLMAMLCSLLIRMGQATRCPPTCRCWAKCPWAHLPALSCARVIALSSIPAACLPAGADAVVMVEHTQSVRQGEVEILRSLAEGENVIKAGEDVLEGQEVLPCGCAPQAGGDWRSDGAGFDAGARRTPPAGGDHLQRR